MFRKLEKDLEKWEKEDNPRPLIIRGARRVGKTYLVKKFGKNFFKDNFAFIDFQTDLIRLQELFDKCTNIDDVINSLSNYSKIDIKPKETLIVFDEVQLCEKALNFLRFFKDSNYKVIATESNLGVTLGKNSYKTLPFPGDVEQLTLCPMDFEEFALACNEQKMIDGIRDSFYKKSSYVLHNEPCSFTINI